MPPKKKRAFSLPHAPPGIGKTYIDENFSTLPVSAEDVKNGHIINIFLSVEKSRTASVRQLQQNFEGSSFSRTINSQIKMVITSYERFKKLSDQHEYNKFVAFCHNHFVIEKSDIPTSSTAHDQEDQAIPGTKQAKLESDLAVSGTSDASSMITDQQLATPVKFQLQSPTDTPGVSSCTRSKTEVLTDREVKLKRRLDFIYKSKSKLKEDLKELRKKLRTPRRVTNQAIKRKKAIIANRDKKIHDLEVKLQGNCLFIELNRTRTTLKKLQLAHNRMKRYRKTKTKLVSRVLYNEVVRKLKEKDSEVLALQHQNLLLQEENENLTASGDEEIEKPTKMISSSMRMQVFDCIVNNVSTTSIPVLLEQFQKRSGGKMSDVPQRTAVELMARELGVISELQVAEVILTNPHMTLGFDATTQEGTHVNEIHFTTEKEALSAAVDELPGGSAEDYANHICQTVDNLARTYAYFNEDSEFQTVRSNMINNISNTMTDRCAANRAAIRNVSSVWGKTLNEMNCHLHPLDSIASSTRAALQKFEEQHKIKGTCIGNDCLAANVILAFNKLRYKDGKGDPRAFVTFLECKKLPKGLIPRYRGNRLHILFNIAGILIEHYDIFTEFMDAKRGLFLGGFRASLENDFKNEITVLELQILGTIGKFLTGPWMKLFYTDANSEISHVDGIKMVKEVIQTIRGMMKDPEKILSSNKDFFGKEIMMDSTLVKLRAVPFHPQFVPMMVSCLQAIIDVLERQYSRYFGLDITDKLREETSSTRSHNINSEEMMGMFSAAHKRAPNATLHFLSCRMRTCKNKTVKYLDGLSDERREFVIRKAITLGRQQGAEKRNKQKEMRLEFIRRQKMKEQSRDDKMRNKVEKHLKNHDFDSLQKDYPELDFSEKAKDAVTEILGGKIVGKHICHVQLAGDDLVPYNGLIRKLYADKTYKISCWTKDECLDDATDWRISMYGLCIDLLQQNLVFSD